MVSQHKAFVYLYDWLGLKEVARIHAEMLDAMRQTGFTGDFPAFLRFLRCAAKDENFTHKGMWDEIKRYRLAIGFAAFAVGFALMLVVLWLAPEGIVGEAGVPAFGGRPVHRYRDFVRPHRPDA